MQLNRASDQSRSARPNVLLADLFYLLHCLEFLELPDNSI